MTLAVLDSMSKQSLLLADWPHAAVMPQILQKAVAKFSSVEHIRSKTAPNIMQYTTANSLYSWTAGSNGQQKAVSYLPTPSTSASICTHAVYSEGVHR